MKPRRLIFLHIEKTGGTAFREQVLRKLYSADEIYEFRGWRRSLLHAISGRARVPLIVGHMDYGLHQIIPGSSYYALVRDPIERAISYYDCINPPTQRYTHPDWDLVSRHPVEEFYRLPFRDNTMTRILCGRAAHRSPRCDAGLPRQAKQHVQRKFALVGFQDDLEDSAKVFLKMLNKPSRDVSLERENARQTAPGREGRPVLRRKDLTDEQQSILEDSHHLDNELYAYLREFYAKKRVEYGIS